MLSRFFLVLSISFFSISAFSKAEVLTLKSYTEITQVFTKETNEYAPGELLVVFDLDRTVLHSNDCLGKKDKSKGFFRFEKTVQLCDATLTSPQLPNIIKELQDKNYGVMALTARRANGFDFLTPRGEERKELHYSMLKGTLRQLEDLAVSEEDHSLAPIYFTTAPLYSNRIKTIKFDQKTKKGISKKELVVKSGVAMASGANKGLALQAFVKRMKKNDRPAHIIFLDDDKKNINNLEKAYENSADSITIIHYTEFEKKKKKRRRRRRNSST